MEAWERSEAVRRLRSYFEQFGIPLEYDIFCILRENLPKIEACQSTLDEIGVVKRAMLAGGHARRIDSVMMSVSACVDELRQYTYRDQVLEAVLAEIKPVADMARQLRQIEPVVAAAWSKLDVRARAILAVYNTLTAVEFESLDVEGDPAVLRDDPALRVLLEGYELARAYLEAEEK